MLDTPEKPESIKRRRVLLVSSGGGHWIELLRLRPAFEGHDVAFVTVNRDYAVDLDGERLYVVPDVTRWNKVRWIVTAICLVWILICERPHVVLSTGALPGFFAIRLAKLLRRRTVWVDSIANVDELSMSGQKIGRHADLWLTQWPHLTTPDGPDCAGAVL